MPAGVQLGLGVKTGAPSTAIHEQGDLTAPRTRSTSRSRAAAISSSSCPSGELAYTRSGNFQLSPDGQIVTADGYTVSPGITVPQDAVEVSIKPAAWSRPRSRARSSWAELGQLQLATFVNEAGLEAIGSNLLLETAASGPALAGPPGTEGSARVLQGFLESSNVNPVQEITALIAAQRAYDMNSKVISASRRDDGHRHPAALGRHGRARRLVLCCWCRCCSA